MLERLHAFRRAIAIERHQRPAEIQRASVGAHDGLHDVRIGRILARHERAGNGRHRHLSPGAIQRIHRQFDQRWLDARLVALHIHHQFAVQLLGHLGDATGAVGMIGTRDHGLEARIASGLGDALVIHGGDDALHALRLGGAPERMHDDRGSLEKRQRLAREARASPAGRHHRDDALAARGSGGHQPTISFTSASTCLRRSRMSR